MGDVVKVVTEVNDEGAVLALATSLLTTVVRYCVRVESEVFAAQTEQGAVITVVSRIVDV